MTGDAQIRRIGTEEHFALPGQVEDWRTFGRSLWADEDVGLYRLALDVPGHPLAAGLLDVGEERLRRMDGNGVAMQALSLASPGVQLYRADAATAMAAAANDHLAETVRRHPDRYVGLGAFAPQDPERAVAEIGRAVNELGFKGFSVNSHTNGEYLDEQRFWPILEALEALDVPLYIHPRTPPEAAVGPFVPYGLATAFWGYHTEVGLHALRLILGGVFDRFQDLRVILGHMGEGIPYWEYRIDYWFRVRQPKAEVSPSERFRRNFTITTSGMNHMPTLRYCLEVLGADRIMWAADYPYQSMADAVAFMDAAEISQEDREKIYYRNAERVFRIT